MQHNFNNNLIINLALFGARRIVSNDTGRREAGTPVAFFLLFIEHLLTTEGLQKETYISLAVGRKAKQKPRRKNEQKSESPWKSKTRTRSLQKATKSSSTGLHPSWRSERRISHTRWGRGDEQQYNRQTLVQRLSTTRSSWAFRSEEGDKNRSTAHERTGDTSQLFASFPGD